MKKTFFKLAVLALVAIGSISTIGCKKENNDILSGTKWMFVRYDDEPVNYMYVEMTFTEDGNIQIPFLTLPYVENGSAISVSYPESTRSHRFILSDDGQSLKILDNFHIFSDTQDVWDTTYFERIN